MLKLDITEEDIINIKAFINNPTVELKESLMDMAIRNYFKLSGNTIAVISLVEEVVTLKALGSRNGLLEGELGLKRDSNNVSIDVIVRVDSKTIVTITLTFD